MVNNGNNTKTLRHLFLFYKGCDKIPMHVIMGSQSRPDGSFPVSEVFEYYRNTKQIPTTSAVNPQEYIDFFTKLRTENPDADILHIAYTVKASSTYQNTVIALEELSNHFSEHRIFLADSKNVSGGISLICEKAAEIVRSAEDGQEALNRLQYWIDRARVSFLPNTLEYLKAGGRVSNAAYLGASILKLKPLINIVDGRLVASKKYRGNMEHVAFAYMQEFIEQNQLDREILYLFYIEGFPMELFEQLMEHARRMGFRKVMKTQVGCVISCHGGPGAFGVAGFAKEDA